MLWLVCSISNSCISTCNRTSSRMY